MLTAPSGINQILFVFIKLACMIKFNLSRGKPFFPRAPKCNLPPFSPNLQGSVGAPPVILSEGGRCSSCFVLATCPPLVVLPFIFHTRTVSAPSGFLQKAQKIPPGRNILKQFSHPQNLYTKKYTKSTRHIYSIIIITIVSGSEFTRHIYSTIIITIIYSYCQ